MKKIVVALLILSLFAFPMVSSKEVPEGILNKFDNFKDCFGSVEERCHQFDYDKSDVVGFPDFGVFVQKHSKWSNNSL